MALKTIIEKSITKKKKGLQKEVGQHTFKFNEKLHQCH